MIRVSLKSVGAYAKQNHIVEDFLYLELMGNNTGAMVLRYLVAQTGMERAQNYANYAFYIHRQNVADKFKISMKTFDRMRPRFESLGIVFNQGTIPNARIQCLWVYFKTEVFWSAVETAVAKLLGNKQVDITTACADDKPTLRQASNGHYDARNILQTNTPKSSDITPKETPLTKSEREIFEYPEDLASLKFYETQVGESIEPFVDELRDEINRLGEKRVISKAKECKNGESWQYLLKSLRRMDEKEAEVPQNPRRNNSDEWQPVQVAGDVRQYIGMTWSEFCRETGEDVNMPTFKRLALIDQYSLLDDRQQLEGDRPLYQLLNDEDDDIHDMETRDIQREPSPVVNMKYGDKTPQEAFDLAWSQLELQLGHVTFDTWLRDVKLVDVDIDTNRYVLLVPNEYAADMVGNRLYRNIRRVLSDVLNRQAELHIVTVWHGCQRDQSEVQFEHCYANAIDRYGWVPEALRPEFMERIKGMDPKAIKMAFASAEQEHDGKRFYQRLIEHMSPEDLLPAKVEQYG